MSAEGATSRIARGAGQLSVRIVRAWRALPSERRLAAIAAFLLFISLFLPWYQETLLVGNVSKLQSASTSLTGWGAFSFVEAAVLLISAGVLTLLFQRAEGRAFHVPGGDGGVIFAAGLWTGALIVWRIFDKQGAVTHGPSATTSGIEWGIFVALAVTAVLAYAGTRIRAAHQPEPALPGEQVDAAAATPPPEPAGPPAPRSDPGERGRPPRARPRPVTFDPPPTESLDPHGDPVRQPRAAIAKPATPAAQRSRRRLPFDQEHEE